MHSDQFLAGSKNVTPTIGIVLKGYPRLSETFIAQEILALQGRGFRLHLISLRRPYDPSIHPIHAAITAPVTYLPEYLHEEPRRVIRAWWRIRRRPGYFRARNLWLADLRRDPSRNRVRRFGQALVLADELAAALSHLHAHFLHTPASVARYCSVITDIPWSCSAHAKDIWTTAAWDIGEKLQHCEWLVTCTQANLQHLQVLAPDREKVMRVYHGIDFERFPAPETAGSDADGSTDNRPVRLLSVGRAVQKKGYSDLLDALAQLPPQLHWSFDHIGGGELLPQLRRQSDRLGLSAQVRWLGAQPQPAVVDAYRSADVFLLSSRIGDDGDRDGLPNVLMEAQSQKLSCIATDVSGIPELIKHDITGMLVAPQDSGALANTITEMITNPTHRHRLGEAGFAYVRKHFAMDRGIDALQQRFSTQLERLDANRDPGEAMAE